MKKITRAVNEVMDALTKIALIEAEDATLCMARHPGINGGTTWCCTRPDGHDGYHISTGLYAGLFLIWENKEATP